MVFSNKKVMVKLGLDVPSIQPPSSSHVMANNKRKRENNTDDINTQLAVIPQRSSSRLQGKDVDYKELSVYNQTSSTVKTDLSKAREKVNATPSKPHPVNSSKNLIADIDMLNEDYLCKEIPKEGGQVVS